MRELNYEIVRSPERKTLAITVERDRSVVVHAPQEIPDSEIQRIIDSKRQWILAKVQHPQKYQTRRHPPGKEVVNGESAPYLGKDYRIEITETASGEVEFSDLFMVPQAHQARKREVLRDWYIARANETIPARAEKHARELGVRFTRAKIVDNRYRWGSCTVNSNINFNWRLIKAPMFVIDYVIVHELAHLIEANHTSRFWGIVRAKTPSMEKARAWLRERGQVLEEEI
jgi:predicted metal-dependent hydrolase